MEQRKDELMLLVEIRDVMHEVHKDMSSLIDYFKNGDFHNKLSSTLNNHLSGIISYLKGVEEDITEVRRVSNWIRFVAFGIISALIGLSSALAINLMRVLIMFKG